MDKDNYLEGRVEDLCRKAHTMDYVTHSYFLSPGDQARVLAMKGVRQFLDRDREREGAAEGGEKGDILRRLSLDGVPGAFYGGFPEAERRVLCFFPSYLSPEDFLSAELAYPSVISCIKIRPLNARFAENLSHRDVLGTVMSLGLERHQIGDILMEEDGGEGLIFVIKEMADLITGDLTSIRHTRVSCQEILPGMVCASPRFEEREGSVASERLDAILSLVYQLSRERAKDLIKKEAVQVDGRVANSGGYELKRGSRVSVRGHGKFIYEGVRGETRKGRLLTKVRVYL